MSVYQEVPSSLGENPYWIFISFLYAWVAAEIAQRFHDVSHGLDKDRRPRVASHLVLAGFVVGTSWIGWTQSFVNHEITVPKDVISLPALMVIIDFVILTMYFNCVSVVGNMRKSELDFPQHDQQRASLWIVLILTMYLTWDVLLWLITYLVVPGNKYSFWTYSWATILCTALAGLVFYLQKKGKVRRLVESDLCLISLILFFRALKQMSHTDKPSILRQIWPQTGPAG